MTASQATVFVADSDSDSDLMILPRCSHLLAGLIPHARLKIYFPGGTHCATRVLAGARRESARA
ncbi:hypothetical protein [Streptomyces virginiae]